MRPVPIRAKKVKWVLAGCTGVTLCAAIVYVIFSGDRTEKPQLVPASGQNAGDLIIMVVGGGWLLACIGWLGWKVILAFRQHFGRCLGVAIVWIAIHYCYVYSVLTTERVGLLFFTIVGGMAFILLARETFGAVELAARKEGVAEERRRAALAMVPREPGEIPFGYRPEDLD